MKKVLLLLPVLASLAYAGVCPGAAPAITSGPTATALSTTSVRVDWTTDSPSDSFLMWSVPNDDGGSVGDASGAGHTATLDTGGVTSHSVTVTGIYPAGISWYTQVRSRCIADTSKYILATVFMSPTAAGAGSYDYRLNFWGAHHVDAGHDLPLGMDFYLLSDTSSSPNHALSVVAQNLPPGATLSTDSGSFVCGGGNHVNVVGTTLTYYQDCTDPINLKITIPSNTTPGTYNTNFHVTAAGGVPAAKDYPWTIVVDSPATFTFGNPNWSTTPQIPCLTTGSLQMDGSPCPRTWTGVMTTYAALRCNDATSIGSENTPYYYDGWWVFLRVKQYDATFGLTGNSSQWDACITNVKNTYLPYAAGSPAGWRVYPRGPYYHWLLNGDTAAKSAVQNLATNASEANLASNANVRTVLTREAVYKLDAELYNAKTGDTSRSAYMQKALDINIGRADEWVTTGHAPYIQPFYTGLWAQSLIDCYESPQCVGYQDKRIPKAIKTVADYLWTNAWNLSLYPNAFYYNSANYAAGLPASAGSDNRQLNHFIAPMYAWLFSITGDSTYQVRGDTIFQNAILLDPVNGGCGETNGHFPFGECYRFSFDYVKWRSAPTTKHVGKGVTVRGGTVR